MQRLQAVLGYAGAILTIVVMLIAPFVLFGSFIRMVARTGVRVDPVYTGGDSAYVLPRDGYHIVVHRPVHSRALIARPRPFVQMAWTPLSALPARVRDEVDVDGDGRPDLVVRFDVPPDTTAPLFVDVTPIGDRVRALHHASRDDISGMIVRLPGCILVRAPLARR